MKQKVLLLVVALVALCTTSTVKAWNGYGHSCAAYIAEQHLTPEAKAKCEHYLQHSFVFYASWMDQWRHIAPFKESNMWHVIYVDKNWKLDTSKKKYAEYQSQRIWKEMKDYKNLPDSLVRQNLIFLIHMVPDFHCPVHTFWAKGLHKDKKYSLKLKGKKFAHHTFWDRSMSVGGREKWTMERYAKEVDVLSPKQQKKYMKGNVIKWANDALKQSKRAYEITPPDMETHRIPKDKLKEIHALSDEMVLKGAYHLAYMINDIFKE